MLYARIIVNVKFPLGKSPIQTGSTLPSVNFNRTKSRANNRAGKEEEEKREKGITSRTSHNETITRIPLFLYRRRHRVQLLPLPSSSTYSDKQRNFGQPYCYSARTCPRLNYRLAFSRTQPALACTYCTRGILCRSCIFNGPLIHGAR